MLSGGLRVSYLGHATKSWRALACRAPAGLYGRKGGRKTLPPGTGPGAYWTQTSREVGMRQRVPRRAWESSGGAGRRPRVLIEDGHPALAVSDFSVYEQAGFDVAFCSGPGASPRDCPLLRGQDCPVVAGADAVLHGLGPGLGIAAAIRRRYPGVAVVVEQSRRADGSLGAVPEGCLPLAYPCSVSGQVDALRRALAARGTGTCH